MAHKGPLELVDSALALVRDAGISFALRAWIAAAPLGLVALVLYELDAMEGVSGLREIGAVAIALAWWGRVHGLSALSAEGVKRLDDAARPLSPATWKSSLRSALVFGLGLSPWALFFVLVGLAGPAWVVVCLPLLAFRGAVAPSWLAQTGIADRRGLRVFRAAVRDTGFRRAASAIAELVVLLGTVAVGLNVMVLMTLGLSLAKSLLGIDIAFAAAFASPSNSFFVGFVGVLAFVLMEPLRAALSAVQYDEARARLEGRDLERLVARAIRGAPGALGVLVAMLVASVAAAQEKPPVEVVEEAAPVVLTPADETVLTRAREILAQPEYDTSPVTASNSLASWIERLWRAFLEWMRQKDEATGGNIERVDLDVSLPPWVYFAIVAVVALLVVVVVIVKRRAPARETGGESLRDGDLDLSVRPEKRLDDAAVLAARGDYRGALRSLYVATLVALGRRGLLRLDPYRTNREYLGALGGAAERVDFADFTRRFDVHWYGEIPATRADYESCRTLAERICAPKSEARP